MLQYANSRLTKQMRYLCMLPAKKKGKRSCTERLPFW